MHSQREKWRGKTVNSRIACKFPTEIIISKQQKPGLIKAHLCYFISGQYRAAIMNFVISNRQTSQSDTNPLILPRNHSTSIALKLLFLSLTHTRGACAPLCALFSCACLNQEGLEQALRDFKTNDEECAHPITDRNYPIYDNGFEIYHH